MSFSGDVKRELIRIMPAQRSARLAELAAFVDCAGEIGPERNVIGLRMENLSAAMPMRIKYFTLLEKTIIIKDKAAFGGVSITDIADTPEGSLRIAKELMRIDEDGRISAGRGEVDEAILSGENERRAYLRGMFLCTGSMSDPGKEYHLEFICSDEKQADQLVIVLAREEIEGRVTTRRGQPVVYVKESEKIAELLGLMGAHVSLMNMENSRILKEIANSVNRRVNCETSNLLKTVTASGRQIADINYIEAHGGLSQLPDELAETARLRLQFPEATLKELGEASDPPVGKSGINHRLRRISEEADRLRR